MKTLNIFLCIFIIFLFSGLIIFTHLDNEKTNDESKDSHRIIQTLITDKYLTEGYCWAYGCYPTIFTLVSVQEDSSGSTTTWTLNVGQVVYNAYQIGNVIEICEIHEKLKEDESKPKVRQSDVFKRQTASFCRRHAVIAS